MESQKANKRSISACVSRLPRSFPSGKGFIVNTFAAVAQGLVAEPCSIFCLLQNFAQRFINMSHCLTVCTPVSSSEATCKSLYFRAIL